MPTERLKPRLMQGRGAYKEKESNGNKTREWKRNGLEKRTVTK